MRPFIAFNQFDQSFDQVFKNNINFTDEAIICDGHGKLPSDGGDKKLISPPDGKRGVVGKLVFCPWSVQGPSCVTLMEAVIMLQSPFQMLCFLSNDPCHEKCGTSFDDQSRWIDVSV